jgi:cardiolipin synthase A/B
MHLTMITLLSRDVSVPLWAVALSLFVLAILILILWTWQHRRDPDFHIDDAPELSDGCESIAGLTHGVCTRGNDVRILRDGEYFDALFEEIESAKRSINFENYFWKKGEVSDRVTEALARAAERGIAVRVLLDASGGSITRRQRKRLDRAGAKFAAYHPFRISNIGRINNRDHRKITVIDGSTAFVGGHCIVDEWMMSSEDEVLYRDTTARVRGPVVHSLQSTFSENWISETGDIFIGEDFFPQLDPEGEITIHVARVSPAGTTSAVKLLYYLAIETARKSLRIQNPYFLPDPAGIEALRRAVERGVEVSVMLPSASATDNPIVQHAGHHKFGALLAGGVRLFEYERTLLHQKVVTVDGQWCAIGSTNFDDRSFELNDEISIAILDEAVTRQLDEDFDRDLEHCVERRLDEWSSRGMIHRAVDGLFFLFNDQL